MTEPTVHQRMVAVLGELPAIGKNQRNQQQGFNFRGIDDVLDALNPLLAKHGVFYLPEVLERIEEQRTTSKGSVMFAVHLHVRYTFYGAGGDSVAASAWGEGTDMGDKATPKAMTGAMKACLFQAFAVSSNETDPDATSPEETVLTRGKRSGGAGSRDGDAPAPAPAPDSSLQERRHMWSVIRLKFGPDAEAVLHDFCKNMGVASSKDLNAAQIAHILSEVDRLADYVVPPPPPEEKIEEPSAEKKGAGV